MSRERCWEWAKLDGVETRCLAVARWRGVTGSAYCDDHRYSGGTATPIPTDESHGWIRTADAMPADPSHVQVGNTGHRGWSCAEAFYCRGGFWLFDHMADAYIAPCCSPSHWMPLPLPPEDTEATP